MKDKKGIFRLGVMAAERVGTMQIPLYAANACYFLVLSVFPLLMILLALVPYLPYSARDLLELLEQVVPEALMGMVELLIVNIYYNSSGTMLGISAVVTMWSASRGIFGILTGLNHIYGVKEDRGYVMTRLISFGYTFVLILLLVLTLVMQVFGPMITGWFAWLETPVLDLIDRIVDLRAVWMTVIQILLFCGIYMIMPNRRNGFRESIPGAVVAAVGWQGFSLAFSFYVEYISNKATIYGSVYTAALAMLWLYCCMYILLFGGGVNRLLQQWLKK